MTRSHAAATGGSGSHGQPAGRADFHTALASPARRRLLQLLRSSSRPLDAHELAGEMGTHLTTVRTHLEVLRQAGLVVRLSGSGGQLGRPRVCYAAVSHCPPSATDAYQQLAQVLAAQVARGPAAAADGAEQAGQRWARRLITAARRPGCTVSEAAVEITGLFGEMGFEPDMTGGEGRQQIALHACPFRAVAREYPQVVCAVHRGLLTGAVAQLGAQADAVLSPFVGPDLCVVEFSAADVAAEAD